MYLKGYSKDRINKNGKIIISIMEEIFKLLINRENGAKILAVSKFTMQAFKVFQKNTTKPKKNSIYQKVKKKII